MRFRKLLKFGEPSSIHLVSTIATPEGISYINKNFDRTHTIWTGTVDKRINKMLLLVFGLGDVGDLSFDSKL